MARMTSLAAGFLLVAVFAAPKLAAAATVPGCKTGTGHAACAPAASLETASKPQTPATGPKPLSEPGAVRTPAPHTAVPTRQVQSAPHAVVRVAGRRHIAVAAARLRHHSRHAARLTGRIRHSQIVEERPRSGPVYDTPPHVAELVPPMSRGCDDVCEYRDWLNRYAAWYRDFGAYYYGNRPTTGGASVPRPPQQPVYSGNIPPPPASRGTFRLDQSPLDRLDPWHGYNGHDGLQNGY